MLIVRRPISLIVLLFCAVPLIAQSDKPRAPKKGDSLIIRGCLRGSAVDSAQTMTRDLEGVPRVQDEVPTLTYRLQGKKELLRELKSRHDKTIVEVSGVLRSELSGNGLSRDVGRTRIRIGLDPNQGRSPYGSDQPVPVLEVTSFEGSTTSCER